MRVESRRRALQNSDLAERHHREQLTMSYIEVILLLSLLISFILLIYVIIYYKTGRVYTRERFAFRVFLLLVSLVATMISLIFSKKSALTETIVVATKLFGLNTPEYEPTLSDKTLGVILILGLIYLAIKLHKNWRGEISTREYEAKLMGLPTGLFVNTIAAVADFSGKSPLEAYSPRPQIAGPLAIALAPTETKAWHQWVARILQLESHQIHIDELKDWYSDEDLFIARYGPKNSIVGILCAQNEPSQNDINKVIEFVSQQVGKPSRLIIAIDGQGQRRQLAHNGLSIDYRFRDELLNHLVDFSAYTSDIEFRYEAAEIAEGYTLRIPDIYVPSSGYYKPEQNHVSIGNVEEFIISWVEEKGLNHLAVLGEYGQGKSVLALRLAYQLLSSGSARVPILITLGGRSPRTQSKLAILADWAAAYDINPKALLALHDAGRLLLIFDGFDEMDLVGDAKLRLDHFRALWEFSRERHSKILLTGRPNFFLDEPERERSLNIRSESMEVPWTLPIYLLPFDDEQIEHALRAFDPGIRSEIVGLVKSAAVSESFKDLISRPSTLFLAANIWTELRSVENPVQILSAEVIGRFIRHSYERQQSKGLKSFLSILEREYFTVGIALAVEGEGHWSNHISKESFQLSIVKLLDGFPSELSKYEPITTDIRPPLKDRLHDREMLIETVSTDVRSSGIIVTDLSQVDTFKFAHKSFLELLVASNLVCRMLKFPMSKEKILHHAAAMAIITNSPGSILDITLSNTPKDPYYSREVSLFSAEILYRLTGDAKRSQEKLERKLADLGIPVRKLRRYAGFFAACENNRFALLASLYVRAFFVLQTKLPLPIFSILAAFFVLCGQGGEEFIKYQSARERRRSKARQIISGAR